MHAYGLSLWKHVYICTGCYSIDFDNFIHKTSRKSEEMYRLVQILLFYIFQCNAFSRYKISPKRLNVMTSRTKTDDLRYLALSQVLSSYPGVFPAKTALPCLDGKGFSLLSWNVLLPNSFDNWWCDKMYQQHVPLHERRWPHRQKLIADHILQVNADIVCIQEAAGESFDQDFAFMQQAGYAHVLHKKFRFRCATFYKPDMFQLLDISHSDRILITSFHWKSSHIPDKCLNSPIESNNHGNAAKDNLKSISSDRLVYIANCHLSGGAAPERRLRQVHEATEKIRKWKQVAYDELKSAKSARRKSINKIMEAEETWQRVREAGVLFVGDFNSDGNTAVRKLLVESEVPPTWIEPQYPTTELTRSKRVQTLGNFTDAAEEVYQACICDGDYGDFAGRKNYFSYKNRRPATYVVPSLGSLFLRPPSQSDSSDLSVSTSSSTLPTSQSPGEAVDIDKSVGLYDGDIQYTTSEGNWDGFDLPLSNAVLVTDKSLETTAKSAAGNEGSELVSVQSEEDVARVVSRFTSGFNRALDMLYNRLARTPLPLMSRSEQLDSSSRGDSYSPQSHSEDGADDALIMLPSDSNVLINSHTQQLVLGESELNEWLVAINNELGRGGMYRHCQEVFEKFRNASAGESSDAASPTASPASMRGGGPNYLTRDEFSGIFARELAEGKWWQVAYDLSASGIDLNVLEAQDQVQMEGLNSATPTMQAIAIQDELTASGNISQSLAANDSSRPRNPRRHYEGWLDYVYYTADAWALVGMQAALTEEHAERIYKLGDALPNSWHPSDHLPVAAVFRWKGDRVG